MNNLLPLFLALVLTLSGCATTSGFYREAKVQNVPSAPELEAFLRSHPRIAKVEVVSDAKEQVSQQMHYFYTGTAPNTLGYIAFRSKDGLKFKYAGYLVSLNESLPQELADASWMFMKELENDMEQRFSIQGLNRTFGGINRIRHPERQNKNEPNK